MRVVVYKCDNCKRALSQKKNTPHLSINFQVHSGWVWTKDGDEWMGCGAIAPTIRQFCNIKCLGDWVFSHIDIKEE